MEQRSDTLRPWRDNRCPGVSKKRTVGVHNGCGWWSYRRGCRRKKNRMNLRNTDRKRSFMATWNVEGALVRPNGITLNS